MICSLLAPWGIRELRNLITASDAIAEELPHRNWSLLIAPEEENFICSDNPVCLS